MCLRCASDPQTVKTSLPTSLWTLVDHQPYRYLDFKPHEKVNTIRTIMAHQILSERRFFAQFIGAQEPLVEELLPPGEKPAVQAYAADMFSWCLGC